MTLAEAFAPTWAPAWMPVRSRAVPTGVQRRDAAGLAKALQSQVAGEVRFDAGSLALYATDLSIYRQVPIGVVIPKSAEDVEATVAECRARGVPILGRGCGTSLSGQTCNVAVVLDFSKYMHRILALDPEGRRAKVEPGVINDQLRHAAMAHALTFAPDPATHQYCTLGGNIGNNSCGAHTVMGGKTVDNVEELEILTYDGLRMRVGATSDDQYELILRDGGRRADIYRRLRQLRDRYGDEIRQRYPNIPRRVSGYNLDDLLPEKGFHVARALVGSESTCALVLSATLRLLPWPAKRALLVLGYPDIAAAADDASELRGFRPVALEAFDGHVIENMRRKGQPVPGEKLLPDGRAWLMVEFGADEQGEANRQAEAAHAALQRLGTHAEGMRVLEKEEEQTQVWQIRENGVGSSQVSGEEEAWPSWEDAALPPERLGDYLRDFAKLNERYGYKSTLFGHFGGGCVHARMTFGLKTAEGVAKFRAYMEEASDLCLSYGGSLSGEHGDGQAKAELLPKMFGPKVIEAFREFKAIWDPERRMNPGKIIDPYPLDSNLRLGPDYQPKPVETWFKYPGDHSSFAHATERCFGVGKCRSLGSRTMCPSFQATREEMHSTRGRAHLLFEMMRGDPLRDGWRDPHVKEALDLCLQCKGCKGDCPVSVDMATYKAEFLAHYYKGRVRPRAAYAMGLIFRWARLASLMPGLTNLATSAPVVGNAIRALAGFSGKRPAPQFAPETFRAWFQRRKAAGSGARGEVMLWADTFNNHFTPHVAQAAVEVLEGSGYRVSVPSQPLCCGRPLYDYGFLDLAKRKLRETMAALRPALQRGIPIVVLEPSCASVFRDELANLFPDDPDARRLGRQCKLLDELLAQDKDYRPPRLDAQALVQPHCHHKAVIGTDAQKRLLAAMGVQARSPEMGCCGLAGSFGYESGHYDVSMAIGEHALLPEVRKLPKEALVVADGFSCRSQIEHGTDRKALHLAEVLQLALHEPRPGPPQPYPERGRTQQPAVVSPVAAAAVLGGAAAIGVAGVFLLRRGEPLSRLRG
ncbi:MAG: FAD-binding and (Fe-S)-binding domain-containing protein [Thiohalocapsa sp.]